MEEERRERLKQLRQRFLTEGVEALEPAEALELLLSYATSRGDVRSQSQELLQKYGSLYNLMSSSVEQLQIVGGLKESPALLLTLVAQASRQIFLEQMERREGAFGTTMDIGRYFMELAHGQRRETFYELCLDRQNTFLGCHELTDGGALSAELETRKDMVRRTAEGALKFAADTVVLCRYQPGGLLTPSITDRAMSERIREALRAIRVPLRDYFLVTDDDFIALSETAAAAPDDFGAL